ncbi:methionyl-tRNA formyltransferase [Candidatus Peregrinibacteria bacterium]|nr:methionyl-tRNA formyltransferase [Candidatus Peregrinibacteria bacterium]
MTNKIPILFIGTADIGAPLLRALSADKRFEVRLVVAQPDKPAGRKLELTPCAIKAEALKLGLPVFTPEKINTPEALEELRKHKPAMIVLMAYGKILKQELLDLPPLGCINVHASLLPRHRGASPIQNCLLSGDSKTGISLMRMEAGMDTGPVYAQFDFPIMEADNAETVWAKISKLTADKTPDTLIQISEGKLKPKPQDDSKATFCAQIEKTDGEIDWTESAEAIARKVRAYAGWPGTHTFWDGKRIKILRANSATVSYTHTPGTVTAELGQVRVTTGDGELVLEEVQMEGKKAQPIGEFIKGHPAFVGTVLG